MNQIEEKNYISQIVAHIVRECPKRQGTSDDERRAHEIIKKEFESVGLKTSVHPFKFNDSLHKNIIIHFGTVVLSTAILPFHPFISFILFLVAATSYWGDTTRRFYFLRRFLGFKSSQNVMGTLPSIAEPKLRIVFLSHIDAAFTGYIFDPDLLERTHKKYEDTPYYLRRPMEVAFKCILALVLFSLLQVIFGVWTTPFRILEWFFAFPSFAITAANLDIIFRNHVVPGANDDLSGVSSLPLLARRLMKDKHPDVEFNFVATGCEETSLGGADALAREMKSVWDQKRTVVLALDGISMGELRYLLSEGEVVEIQNPAWLTSIAAEIGATDPKFSELRPFHIPVGGTDAAAFLYHGFESMALVCEDPKYGTPRYYHRPEDSPENLDVDHVLFSVDFTEKLVKEIIARRLK